MMFNKKNLLSTALLAGTSLAQTTTDDGASPTGGGGNNAAACTRSYASLLINAPSPTGPLGSAITSYASSVTTATAALQNPAALATQVCEFSSQLPETLHGDFDAYATSVRSYVSASRDAINAVITDCVVTDADEAASLTSLVDSFATHSGPICEQTGGAGNGTTTTATTVTETTGTGTGTITPVPTNTEGGGETTTGEGGGGATETVPTAAAAQPTAFLGAVAAGLLGVVALL